MTIFCAAVPTTLVWRGVTIGMSGEPTFTSGSKIDGLDLPPVDAADLPVRMGSQPGRIAWPARDVAATAVFTRTPSVGETLRAAMVAGDAPLPPEALDVTCPTLWSGTRRLWARPRRCTSSITRGQMVTRGLLRDLQWTALDPRFYAVTETEHPLPGSISQVGNVSAGWRAVLTGPVSGPEVRRTDTGDAIRWPSVTLGAGQTLAIDLRAQTAVVNGTVEVWGLSVDDNGEPPLGWEIEPGVAVPVTTNAAAGILYVAPAWL